MAKEETEKNVSEFNMSVSYLNRINQWFYLAVESRVKLDAFNWFQAVTLLFSELSTEMKDDEIKAKNKEIIAINKLVVNNQRKNMNTKQIAIPEGLWIKLHNFELSLRKIMKESGLQIKMKEHVDIAGL